MKKLFLIGLIAVLSACSAQPETGYTVNVTANGDLSLLPNDTLIFRGGTDKNPAIDTAVLVNGKCTIKGEINTPTFYDFTFKGEKFSFTSFFLEENARIDVAFDAANPFDATITGGGEAQEMVSQMRAKFKELNELYKFDSLRKAVNIATATEEDKMKMANIFKEINAETSKIEEAYISANPVSPYSLYQLKLKVYYKMSYEEIVAALAPFDTIPAYAENVLLKEYKEFAEYVKSTLTGNPAPDFVQNAPDGKPVKFSDIYSKNKLTMLDFWASWCRPCRAFNPELIKIYKKYHNKGFEILGVSLDSSHDAWVKGIKDDKLTWPQVSDLNEWDNEAGRMYNIKSVPHNVFVDQNGVIVARGVAKKEVAAFIEEYLKK